MMSLGNIPKQLRETVKGDVITRFPPENSGYLHIGHLKAIMINRGFADMYKGKMLLRIDDTNPSKEEEEYERSIIEDLKTLGIKYDGFSHTSDYFEKLIQIASDLVERGLAYVDTSSVSEMKETRRDCKKSKCRDQTIEINRDLWRDMQVNTVGTRVLRLKMQYDSENGSLRDPVIFRVIDKPHHITKDRFRVYPTYDFACPIVDSIEGVTHTMRTNEYSDGNPLYVQILKMLDMRCPILYCYGRIDFEGVDMSKRKIKKSIEDKVISGWDDFRLPTIRGVLKAGFAKETLIKYFIDTGFAKNTIKTTWDKFIGTNRKIIDRIAGRYHWVKVKDPIKLTVNNHQAETITIPLFYRNSDLGDRELRRSESIYIDREIFDQLKNNEEITLMNWGNMIIDKDKFILTKNLDGDVKSTQHKVVWVSCDNCRKIEVLKDIGGFKTPEKYELLVEGNVSTKYVQLIRSGYIFDNGDFWVEVKT